MRKRKLKLNNKVVSLILGFFVSILLFSSEDFEQIKHFKLQFSNFFSALYHPKAFFNDINYLSSENDSLLNHIKIISEENLNLKQRIRTINDHLNYDKKLDNKDNKKEEVSKVEVAPAAETKKEETPKANKEEAEKKKESSPEKK